MCGGLVVQGFAVQVLFVLARELSSHDEAGAVLTCDKSVDTTVGVTARLTVAVFITTAFEMNWTVLSPRPRLAAVCCVCWGWALNYFAR